MITGALKGMGVCEGVVTVFAGTNFAGLAVYGGWFSESSPSSSRMIMGGLKGGGSAGVVMGVAAGTEQEGKGGWEVGWWEGRGGCTGGTPVDGVWTGASADLARVWLRVLIGIHGEGVQRGRLAGCGLRLGEGEEVQRLGRHEKGAGVLRLH